MASSCQCTSVLLADDEQVVDSLVHRLQVFHIVELYQECQPFMLVQVIERRLSRHREAFPKSMHRSCKVWYHILAHILTFSICKSTTFFQFGKIYFTETLLPVSHQSHHETGRIPHLTIYTTATRTTLTNQSFPAWSAKVGSGERNSWLTLP